MGVDLQCLAIMSSSGHPRDCTCHHHFSWHMASFLIICLTNLFVTIDLPSTAECCLATALHMLSHLASTLGICHHASSITPCIRALFWRNHDFVGLINYRSIICQKCLFGSTSYVLSCAFKGFSLQCSGISCDPLFQVLTQPCKKNLCHFTDWLCLPKLTYTFLPLAYAFIPLAYASFYFPLSDWSNVCMWPNFLCVQQGLLHLPSSFTHTTSSPKLLHQTNLALVWSTLWPMFCLVPWFVCLMLQSVLYPSGQTYVQGYLCMKLGRQIP